jgi:uncharacterized membrane protein
MSNKTNMVSRKASVALGILCIATLIGLNFSVITYYNAMNTKNTQIQTLNDQNYELQVQIANLTAPAPKLLSLGMQYADNRTNPNATFLHVTGYIVNVGSGTANNIKLNINAIQNGNGTAINTSIPINPVEAGTYQKIDTQLPYTGDPIIAYSGNLEWGT